MQKSFKEQCPKSHRPVAMNFIDGSREWVDQIISQLARNL